MSSYIPQEKNSRYQWLNTFHTNFVANATALGFTAMDAAALTDKWDVYDPAFADAIVRENAYNAGLATLGTATDELVDLVRGFVATIQANPTVTDAQRSAAGIPIHSTTRTPASVPTTRPTADVDTSQRLQHTLHFRDEGSANRAKPAGVRGAEIWCFIGPGPATVTAAHYLGTDTKTPYVATFDPEDAGKTAHYFLRWVNTRNQHGPWSETVSATIGG